MQKPALRKASLRRLVYGANLGLGMTAGVVIGGLVVLTTMEVIKRRFLNSPSEWVMEISEYLLILSAFFGMAYALQIGAHVMVNIVYRYYSKLSKRVIELIVGMLSLTFWSILTWIALRQALVYLAFNTRSQTLLAVPQFYPMMSVVLGSLFCCFQALVMIYDAIVSLPGGGEPESERPIQQQAAK